MIKYKISFWVLLAITNVKGFAQIKLENINHLGLGLDLSQFNYYVSSGKIGPNLGVVGYFKPFNFVSLNGGVYVNDINEQRGNGYSNLSDYRSVGTCFKIGPELSLRVLKNKGHRRLTWGYNYSLVSFRESGHFKIKEDYWGDHNYFFKTPNRSINLWEYTLGYQFTKERITVKTQVYAIFDSSDRKLREKNNNVEVYDPVFVPGYGFVRGGLNLNVYYRLSN